MGRPPVHGPGASPIFDQLGNGIPSFLPQQNRRWRDGEGVTNDTGTQAVDFRRSGVRLAPIGHVGSTIVESS